MMKTDDEITKELQEATAGLLWMSESDYPFEVVKWNDVTTVTEDLLRQRAVEADDAPIETRSIAEFFRVATGEQVWHSTQEQATARRYRRLVELLNEDLTEAKAYRIGRINLAALILGRSPAGTIMGIGTRLVET